MVQFSIFSPYGFEYFVSHNRMKDKKMNRVTYPHPPGKVLTAKGHDIGLPLDCTLKRNPADESKEREGEKMENNPAKK